MASYFERLVSEWKATHHTLPQIAYSRDTKHAVFVGERDESGWIEWQPIRKEPPTDFSRVERELAAALHPSIREYFGSYWFCSLGGYYGHRFVQLDPAPPHETAEDLIKRFKAYRTAHGGVLAKIPVGVEATQDLLVVVDNASGRVEIEDYERGTFDPLADSLAQLIAGLRLTEEMPA